MACSVLNSVGAGTSGLRLRRAHTDPDAAESWLRIPELSTIDLHNKRLPFVVLHVGELIACDDGFPSCLCRAGVSWVEGSRRTLHAGAVLCEKSTLVIPPYVVIYGNGSLAGEIYSGDYA